MEHNLESVPHTFASLAGVELNRAERYRIFVALTVIDLGFTKEIIGVESAQILMQKIEKIAQDDIRTCDYISFVDTYCLGLLFPETSRQGAEVAVKRITEKIRSEIIRVTKQEIDQIIPVELASYPDAAGARTVAQFVEDLQHRSRN